MRVESVLELTHLLDYTMPGIKGLLKGWNETNRKNKLGDFAEEYWHYDSITELMQKQFMDSYLTWTKKGYHQNRDKAAKEWGADIFLDSLRVPKGVESVCIHKMRLTLHCKIILSVDQ